MPKRHGFEPGASKMPENQYREQNGNTGTKPSKQDKQAQKERERVARAAVMARLAEYEDPPRPLISHLVPILVVILLIGGAVSTWLYVSSHRPLSFNARTTQQLDEQFTNKLGHPYYTEQAPHGMTTSSIPVGAGLQQIRAAVDFEKVYKIYYFDCSEMSAYLEYYFENVGYDAKIVFGTAGTYGAGHAWVTVYAGTEEFQIEPTNLTIISAQEYSSGGYSADSICDSIYEIEEDWSGNLAEWDWWDTEYAGKLAELPFES